MNQRASMSLHQEASARRYHSSRARLFHWGLCQNSLWVKLYRVTMKSLSLKCNAKPLSRISCLNKPGRDSVNLYNSETFPSNSTRSLCQENCTRSISQIYFRQSILPDRIPCVVAMWNLYWETDSMHSLHHLTKWWNQYQVFLRQTFKHCPR